MRMSAQENDEVQCKHCWRRKEVYEVEERQPAD